MVKSSQERTLCSKALKLNTRTLTKQDNCGRKFDYIHKNFVNWITTN